MKKSIVNLFFGLMLILGIFLPTHISKAEELPDYNAPSSTDYYQAQVIEILEKGQRPVVDTTTIEYQTVKIKLLNGALKDQMFVINQEGTFTDSERVNVGEKIIVIKSDNSASPYYVVDTYRLPALQLIGLLFLFVIIIFGRKKGFMAIIGMIFSILILSQFVIPSIMRGANSMFTIFMGITLIAIVSLYVAHGVNKRTTIALACTMLTLIIAWILSEVFVRMASLYGSGTEEAFAVQSLTNLAHIDLRALLIGGIVLGALGILDDITTGQAAVVEELSKANPLFGFKELYRRGLSVGYEHIASLVNTLVLAYAGVSLPLFLLFSSSSQERPWWFILNSQPIAQEIVRTIVGSIALILAVPITTAVAAYVFGVKEKNN